ncbi:MAG TPA: outer membrane beta-barrel protein, partial [Vicinamibacteria bacterium]|nr:outer membrane beta-barrel protein [Vicinamibacteria bacterium]
ASRWRWGWDVTVGFQRALDARFSLGLRAGWSEGGGRVEDAAGSSRLDADLQELTVPLTLEAHGRGDRVRPFAFAGPAFVWRRRTELAVFAGGDELVREDITSDVDDTGWALTAGAGLELGSGTVRPVVEAQYLHGLSGLDPADPSAEDFVGARSRAFQLRVGLRFGS